VHAPARDLLQATLKGAQWRGTGYRLDLDLTLSSGPCPVRAEVATMEGLPPVGQPVGVSIPDGCPLVTLG
jgi:2-aminoethylphosphonate transport system ATP-binding protein